ncbi:MAG TPA: hypothetical protein VKX49_16415 [Bryobacteraceae bacterium]|nr:hypothetical protein [Bryobacteraceae bacterium]
MLADTPDTSAQFGTLSSDVQKPSTFRHELIDFIAGELPRWRDRPDRPAATAEISLTSQLCGHLNGASRHTPGFDILQFRVEEQDEQQRGRKIDMVASPCGASICVEGRRHTEFDSLMPIECKRLPTPKGIDRDEREYVISRYSSTGGIQRFKEGNHASAHTFGAMIGYLQEEATAVWDTRLAGWINELAGVEPGWTTFDLLHLDHEDKTLRLAVFRSSHGRKKGLAAIELRHLWLEMN